MRRMAGAVMQRSFQAFFVFAVVLQACGGCKEHGEVPRRAEFHSTSAKYCQAAFKECLFGKPEKA